jgi:hypothetical protein
MAWLDKEDTERQMTLHPRHYVLRLPMGSDRVRETLSMAWGRPMAEGEAVLLEGVGARVKGLGGGRWGPVLITNQRVIWYETANTWPLPRIKGEVSLSDVESVDKGTLLDFIFGGYRLRMHLHNGKIKTLYEGQDRLDEWIVTIRGLIGEEKVAGPYPSSSSRTGRRSRADRCAASENRSTSRPSAAVSSGVPPSRIALIQSFVPATNDAAQSDSISWIARVSPSR